jgi:hypothetical protein
MMKAAERKDVAEAPRRDNPAHGALRIMAIGKRAKSHWLMETCFAGHARAAKPAQAA